jgi:hypothetical protein
MIEIFLTRNGSIPFIQGKLKMSYSSDLPHSTKMDRLDKVSSAILSLSNGGDTDQMMVDWTNTRKAEEHTPSICEQRNMRIVYENVVNLLKNLPESAHFRKPLIKQLFKGIKQTDISQACGITESTVSQTMKCNTDEFEGRHGGRQSKVKVSATEKHDIKELIANECPVASGKLYHWQIMTDNDLYDKYVEHMESIGMPVRNKRVVVQVKKSMPLRKEKTYYGHFECDKCRNNNNNMKTIQNLTAKQNTTETESKILSKALKNVATCEFHQRIGPMQRNNFRCMRESLDNGTCIVVQDFTKHYPYAVGHSNPVVNMVVVLIYLDASGCEYIEYLDILSNEQPSGHQFAANAWIHIVCKYLLRFQKWEIWSDGCAKEFKCMQMHVFYSWLQTIVIRRLRYHFFVSNHSHNMADGHAGVTKRAVKSAAISNTNNATIPDDFRNLFEHSCANTISFVLEGVHKFNYQNLVKKWSHGVKKYHCIRYTGIGKVITSETTHDDDTNNSDNYKYQELIVS